MTSRSAARTDKAVSLSSILGNDVVDREGKSFGAPEDVVATLRGEQFPLVRGLVVESDGARVLVPMNQVTSIDENGIELRAPAKELNPFQRRDGEVLLKQDVLDHRLIDIDRVALVKAYDIRLALTVDGWIVVGPDVHKHRWFRFGHPDNISVRDWGDFIPVGALSLVDNVSRVRRLKPAQIADIVEGASAEERQLLLAQLHADPELEADVFEELDDDSQASLLRARSDSDIANVLSRMRADDAADAVMELPQDRRRNVLDLLPQPQNTKVLTLLGYNDATAGGLMGTDYLALSEGQSIADALQKLREATTQQPEALTTIYSLKPDGTLAGTLGLVRALQLDPAVLLRDAADSDTVVASPEDDLIAVTTRMADFNLLNLPVVDTSGRILGIITVDDALEAAIPRDWSRREPSHMKRILRTQRTLPNGQLPRGNTGPGS